MDDRDLRWQAVERAYRDHADDVYRVASRSCATPMRAVDATHDTFARAFERWHQYDANRPLRGLAARHRQPRRARHASGADGSGRSAIPALGRVRADGRRRGADPAATSPNASEMAAAMGDLKPDARAALVLRHYYGYDYAEIARFLRTSPGNVGSILSRAHATLADPTRRRGRRTQTDIPAPRRALR